MRLLLSAALALRLARREDALTNLQYPTLGGDGDIDFTEGMVCGEDCARKADAPALEKMLRSVRAAMTNHSLAAYVVSHADAHGSESLADADEFLAALTGFTGSAGTAVLTPEQAFLWTDGRYWLQAEEQLGPGWELMRAGPRTETPSVAEWLTEHLPEGAKVGVDAAVTPVWFWRKLADAAEAAGASLVKVPNLVTPAWTDRPGRPTAPVVALESAGENTLEKLTRIRRDLARKKRADAVLFSRLDDVAWVLNARGGDVPYTPVFFAYLLVEREKATVFTDKDLKDVLLQDPDVEVAPYDALLAKLEGMAVWMDSGATVALQDAAKRAIVDNTPVQLMKSKKNAAEIAGMKASHLRDGAAKTRFLFWAQEAMQWGGETEVTMANQLEGIRKEQGNGTYRGASFPTISAFGGNAAIVHYEPHAKQAHEANPDKLYLVDSGGQYVDGTTDVTRTVSFQERPGELEREAYTRVLKGLIALSTAVFPEKVSGPYLDALARQHLWRAGLNYEHGTGHGVGHFLGVHEGPISISSNPDQVLALHAGLEPGMVLSNEPGYYEDGAFGIRIENMMLVVPAETPHQIEGKRFLTFETLTLVPLDKSLVNTTLLTSEEVKWVDEYHARVQRELAPLLDASLHARLADACAPLSAAYASLLLVVAARFAA